MGNRGRYPANPEDSVTAIDAIKEQAKKLVFGEWKLSLIIYDGKVTGFDEIEVPLMKFREKRKK